MRCRTCARRRCGCEAPGSRPPPSRARPIAPVAPPCLSGLVVGEVLGEGGFATVYAATDAATDLAIKLAHGRDATTWARFEAEAQALEQIGPPAVPRLLGPLAAHDRRPYLRMERLRGQTLAAWLATLDAPASEADWRPWFDGLLDAVGTVHRVGLVHRDLKPENVFRRDDGRIVLLDLGLVGGPGRSDLTRSGVVIGTTEYVAPELLRDQPAEPGSDVYALGVILYELLTLRVPFAGDAAAVEHAHLLERPLPPSQHAPTAAAWDTIAMACLAKPPAERPSLAALRASLRDRDRRPALVLPTDDARPVLRSQGLRTVALIAVHGLRIDELATLARRHRATVARFRGERAVLAIVDGDAPIDQAVSLAIAASGATAAVVHVAPVRIREVGGREPQLFGAALDDLVWCPGDACGVLVTDVAARAAVHHRLRPAAYPGCFELDGAPAAATEVVGRDPELALFDQVCADLDGGPWLMTIIGEAGLGKTALSRAMATRAAQGDAPPCVVRHQARRGEVADDLLTLATAIAQAVAVEPPPASAAHAVLHGPGGGPAWATLSTTPGERRALDAARALAVVMTDAARARPLVIVIDDGQAAAIELLDAVELATAAPSATPLAVIVIADRRLLELRPRWATRAHRTVTASLGPLGADAARAMLAPRLLPATRISVEILDRLVGWAGGVPRQLDELARMLQHAGAIRAHPGSDEWYVAADHLDALPPSTNLQWLAERELAALAPELAALARVCAVLGDELDLAEIEAVQPGDDAARRVDTHGGTSALVDAGILVRDGRAFRFRLRALQEGIYAATAPGARAELHARAFRHWLDLPAADSRLRAVRMAYHGAPAGRTVEARACHLALAAHAQRRHAYLEAERHFSHALDLSTDEDRHLRLHALTGRGAVRRHLTHYEQARTDLIAARALADALDDTVAAVECLVEESAVCDFLQRYGDAALLAEEARRRAPPGLPPGLHARLCNWLGVARFHQHRDAEAVELLGLAIALGDAMGEHASVVGASLILAHTLLRLGRRDDALALLDDVIDRCRDAGDHFHLACAHSNRVVVWRELGDAARASEDLETVVSIARDFGFAVLEAAGLANLAEHLCWEGRVDDALVVSARAHRQSTGRFREQPLIVVSLYHAQLLAHAGQLGGARDVLDELGTIDLTDPLVALMHEAVRLALAGAVEGWSRVHDQAAGLACGQQPVEMWWLEGRVAARRGDRDHAGHCLARAVDLARPHARTLAETIEREWAALVDEQAGGVRSRDNVA